MSQSPNPHWRVRYRRRQTWAVVMTKPAQPDFTAPPVPEEFGIRYLAALEGAAQLLHGAEAVEIERHPPLEPATTTTLTTTTHENGPDNPA